MAGRWFARAALVNADLECPRRSAVAGDRREGRSNGPSGFATFIVRVSQDSAGAISGVVESVRSGEKIRFHGLAAISEVIAGLVERAMRDQEPL